MLKKEEYYMKNLIQTNKKYKVSTKQKKIEKVILDTAIKLAKQGIGSLTVFNVGNKVDYDNLFEIDLKEFNILDSIRQYEVLAAVDGAVIVDENGIVKSYCAMIKDAKPYKQFGTRHAAAYTASMNNNIAILSSEEDHKVRAFKDGKLIMQLDSLEKGIEQKTEQAVNMFESIGVGFASYSTAALIGIPMGITILPGVILFGTGYAIMKYIIKHIEEDHKNSRG